jgi:hypothetical protein
VTAEQGSDGPCPVADVPGGRPNGSTARAGARAGSGRRRPTSTGPVSAGTEHLYSRRYSLTDAALVVAFSYLRCA